MQGQIPSVKGQPLGTDISEGQLPYRLCQNRGTAPDLYSEIPEKIHGFHIYIGMIWDMYLQNILSGLYAVQFYCSDLFVDIITLCGIFYFSVIPEYFCDIRIFQPRKPCPSWAAR